MIKLRCWVIVALLAISANIIGQDAQKGFKALEKADFEKAKETFAKNIATQKSTVASRFGLVIVFSAQGSPYVNLLDAYEQATEVRKKIDEISPDDLTSIGEYLLATEERKTSRPPKKKIEMALDDLDARLIGMLREENNLELIYEVIKRFPSYKYYDNVIHIRNYQEYRKVEGINTLEAYNGFISRFPDAAQVPQAITKRDHLAFVAASATNTVEAYNAFLKQYPDATDASQAVKKRNEQAFVQAKARNSVEVFEQYLIQYPDALEAMQARKILQDLLYAKAKEIRSIEAYNAFIAKYPDGKQFVDVFNLKMNELGRAFLSANPSIAADILVVKGFDKNEQNETSGTLCPLSDGGLMVVANSTSDSGITKLWATRLDAMGNMVWNKATGERFSDFANCSYAGTEGVTFIGGKTTNPKDTSQFEGWVLTLASDGKKLWSRTLGIPEVTALYADASGTYVGGSYLHDSTGFPHLYLMKLNAEGRKLWARNYLNQGEIARIEPHSSSGALVAGAGNWLFKADTDGYLMWEHYFSAADSITTLASGPKGELFVAGTDTVSAWAALYDATGKRVWLKIINKPGHLLTKSVIKPDGTIVATTGNGMQAGYLVFSPTGTINSDKTFDSKYISVTDLVLTKEGKPAMMVVGAATNANVYCLLFR